MDPTDTEKLIPKVKNWCLLCGKFKSEHTGSCTTKMSTVKILKLIREQRIEAGQPLKRLSGKVNFYEASNKGQKLEFVFYKSGKEKGIFYEFSHPLNQDK